MLHILHSGPFTTVQDAGRLGFEQFGVPVSGALDGFAFNAANRLVGNASECAVLEIGLGGVSVSPHHDALMALAGPDCVLTVQGRTRPTWLALFIRRGWAVEITVNSGWAYLAIAGGIDVPLIMDSRSTYARGGFGGYQGRALQANDILPLGPSPNDLLALAGRTLPPSQRPAYSLNPTVEVILGPQLERFTARGVETFLNNDYAVSATSDRMGYRLIGPPIEHTAGADLLSEGMALGAIQVPADGQPLMMMSERPTTGGYPKIATVVRADHPPLAQCAPGVGRLRFRATTLTAAQARYRAQQKLLSLL